MTYEDMKGLVKDFINRSDLPDSLLEKSIQVTLQRLQRTLRVPSMERKAIITLTAGENRMDIMGDYLSMRLILAGGSPVERKSHSYISGLEPTAKGQPLYFSRDVSEFVFYPTPDTDTEVSLSYYAEAAPLVNPEDTNLFLKLASDVILYGALTYLAEYFNDNRGEHWEAKYNQRYLEVETHATEQEYSGSSLAIGTTEDY